MKTLLFIILIGDLVEPALASALSEREMLVRCYGHLTGQRIPTGHALWTQISAGKRAVRREGILNRRSKIAYLQEWVAKI